MQNLDTAERPPTTGQSFESGLACAAIDPMELRFPFKLTNRTDDAVAFITKANRDKYYAHPKEGVLQPCSRCYIVVTMRPASIRRLHPGTQCNDVFLVQSRRVRVSGRVTPDVVAEQLRKLWMGEVMVDEARLPIVKVEVPVTQPPSTSR